MSLLQINSQQIRDNAVIASKILNSAVTADKLANNAVTTDKILDGNVTNAKVASGIDAAKIGSGTVSNTEFGYLDGVTSSIQGQLDNLSNGTTLDGRYVNTSGDTMTGSLTLNADPTSALHAATKQYVDAVSTNLDNHINDTSDAHDASAISFTAVGDLAATDVQAALAELDTEKLALAGGTMTGFLTLNGDPTSALHATTKQYVDAVAQGLGIKQAVRAATTADLDATYDNGVSGVGATLGANNNGAIVVDGVTLSIGDRVLVKNQTNGEENGIYDVTITGDAGNPFELTRSDDANNSPVDGELRGGTFVFVTEGSTQDNQGYAISSPTGAIVLGTDDIVWTQFNGAGSIVAGNGLGQSGNTLSVNVDDSTIEINADTLRVKDAGITNAKIATGIDAAKIADGSVSNAEFQYLGGVTSDIQTQLNAKAVSADLASTANALGASLIGIEDAGTYFTGTTVEAALQEIGADLAGLSFAASAISYTPGGNISATNVQAAIQELDTEKVAKAGDTMTGQLQVTSGGILVNNSSNNVALEVNQTSGNNGIRVTTTNTAAALYAQSTNASAAAGEFNNNQVSGTGLKSTANNDTAIALDLNANGTGGIALRVNSGQSLFNGTAGVTIAAGNTISWADAPTADAHLANKQYVDNAVSGAAVGYGYEEFVIDSTDAATNASGALALTLANSTTSAGQFIRVYINGQLQIFDNLSNSSIAAYTKPSNTSISLKQNSVIENDVVQIHYNY